MLNRRRVETSSTPTQPVYSKDTVFQSPSQQQQQHSRADTDTDTNTNTNIDAQRPLFSSSCSPSTSSSCKPQDIGSETPLLQIQYHDQVALDAFSEALLQDVGISAASDFAPINQRTTKRRARYKLSSNRNNHANPNPNPSANHNMQRGSDSGNREGFVYNLLRFPLLLAIFLTIFTEFMAYVVIRQIV